MAQIIIDPARFERALHHPLFSQLAGMEFRPRGTDLDSVRVALHTAIRAAVDGLAEADPADLLVSDAEFERWLKRGKARRNG